MLPQFVALPLAIKQYRPDKMDSVVNRKSLFNFAERTLTFLLKGGNSAGNGTFREVTN